MIFETVVQNQTLRVIFYMLFELEGTLTDPGATSTCFCSDSCKTGVNPVGGSL